MKDQKRILISRYFMTPPWKILIFIGIICLILSPLKFFLNIMLIGLIAAAILVFKSSIEMPSDSQIDKWVDEDINSLESKALRKCCIDALDQIRKPILITGPRLHDLGGADFVVNRGRDRKVRFNPIDVAIINFTPDYLSIYHCALDLTTGNALNEAADEFFYKDVVAISTQASSTTSEKKKLGQKIRDLFQKTTTALSGGKLQLNNGEEFSLATSGGSSVRIFLGSKTLIQAAAEENIPMQLTDQAIQAVRKMLREKKAA